MQDTLHTNAAVVSSFRKTILIVESNLERGYTLAQALKEETPYRVLFATDAFQALQIMRAVLPQVMVLASHALAENDVTLLAFSGSEHPAIMLISARLPHGEIEEQQLMDTKKLGVRETFVRLVQELLR